MTGFTINWSSPLVAPIITACAGFLGVLVGTALVPWLRNRGERRRAAQYLAIQVVCVLDKYIADCASVSGDEGEPDEDGCLSPRHSEPDAPVYPQGLNWHSIDHKLMYDLLSLPAAAGRAANYVSAAVEHSGPPDFEEIFEARTEEYGKLAILAHGLAARLRKEYGIDELEYDHWSPAEYAQKQLDELKARKEARAEEFRNAMAKSETQLI